MYSLGYSKNDDATMETSEDAVLTSLGMAPPVLRRQETTDDPMLSLG